MVIGVRPTTLPSRTTLAPAGRDTTSIEPGPVGAGATGSAAAAAGFAAAGAGVAVDGTGFVVCGRSVAAGRDCGADLVDGGADLGRFAFGAAGAGATAAGFGGGGAAAAGAGF